MLSHSTRRWLAGLGVAGALIAASATPAAAADDPFKVNSQDVVAVPGQSGFDNVSASTNVSDIPFQFGHTTLDIDLTGVSAFADLEPARPGHGWACATVELLLRCTTEIAENRPPELNIRVTVRSGATPGQVGQLKVAMTAGGYTIRTTSTVTIAEPIDLRTDPTVTVSGAPGSRVATPANVRNGSETTSHGAVVITHGTDSFQYVGNFSNCRPTDTEGAVCFFDEQLEPGKRYRLSTGLPFQLAADARTGATLQAISVWFTKHDWEWEDPDYPQGGPPGTGSRLRLVEEAAAVTRAPQKDPDITNNHSRILVKVTGNQPADLSVKGATADGRKDDVVQVRPSVTNLGPAQLEYQPEPLIRVTIPEGTTAVEVPEYCQPYDEWDPSDGTWGKPGAEEYGCNVMGGKGEEFFYQFGLRIDTVIPDASGAIRVGLAGDPNSANDTAKIVINPRSLPITGTPTGLTGGIGGLLLVAGLGVYLLARRRRTRFVA